MIQILLTGRSGLLDGRLIRKEAAEKALETELLDCRAGIQRAYPKA